MMEFFNNVQKIQELTGYVITEAVKLTHLKSSLIKATREVIKYFPKTLLTRLFEATPQPALKAFELEIKEAMQGAIANLAVLYYIPIATAKITGSGVQQYEKDEFKSLFKYQKEDLESMLKAQAYEWLEAGILLLVGKDDYKTTPEYMTAVQRLLNVPSDCSYYDFDFVTLRGLLPCLDLIEYEVVLPLLGTDLYTEIREKQYDEDLSSIKKQLLGWVRNALTQYLVTVALQTNTISLKGNNVTLREYKNDDSMNQRVVPTVDYIDIVKRTREDYTTRFFGYIKSFLKQNATDLGYQEPTVETVTETFTAQLGVKTLF